MILLQMQIHTNIETTLFVEKLPCVSACMRNSQLNNKASTIKYLSKMISLNDQNF